MSARMAIARVCALAALLIGCGLPAQTSVPLDSSHGPIVFALTEQKPSRSAPLTFAMVFSTQRSFSCGMRLVAAVKRVGRVITVSDWKLPSDELCSEEISPASGRITLPLTDGPWTLIMSHLGVQDRYSLLIDRELVHLAPASALRVSVTADSLIRRRIPNSFVVRCGGAAAACGRAFREVATVPGIRALVIPPNGRNPFGDIVTPFGTARRAPLRYFTYASESAYDAVRKAVERVGEEMSGAYSGTKISLALWTDETWIPLSTDRDYRTPQ